MYLGSKLLGGGKHKNEGKGQEAPPRTVAPTSPAAVEDGDPQRVGTAMRLCSSCILEKLPFGVSDMEIWDSRLVLATSKGAVYIYAPLQSSVELTAKPMTGCAPRVLQDLRATHPTYGTRQERKAYHEDGCYIAGFQTVGAATAAANSDTA
eukprot:scaffold1085_cov407-Prasinococcus_capsulatus_cf.AAC.36